MKLNYNQPQILDRINSSCEHVRKLSKRGVSQFEIDYYYWSFENLTQCLQKKLLDTLIFYWWPKYCIRLYSFQDYMKKKYPTYHEQINLLKTTPQTAKSSQKHEKQTSNLNAQNIEKSLTFQKIEPLARKGILNRSKSSKANETNASSKKLLKNRKNLENNNQQLRSVKIVENDSITKKKSLSSKNRIPVGLEGYDLKDDYKTSPPVGWKRPPSQATLVAKMIYENGSSRIKKADSGENQEAAENKEVGLGAAKKSKNDRDIYFEAIYREDLAGKIFMKYLINKNKIVSDFYNIKTDFEIKNSLS